MKIKNLLLAIVAILLLGSCEKDKDNDSSSINDSYRIKQIISQHDDYFEKIVFSYYEEKLLNINAYEKDESGNLIEEFKIEISYSGDNATTTMYDKETGNWEIRNKSEYVIQNGLIMEISDSDYENAVWVEYCWKWTYQYSASNITAWQSYYFEDENGKGEYVYQNGKLSEYKVYELDESDNWHQFDNETFTYEGTDLMSWIDYELDESDNWEKDNKAEYLYSGDKVLQMECFNWISESSQWELENSETYTYNSNGYLIEELNNEGNKRTYEYEEGQGNAKYFLYYPENLVYGEPTLKSASLNENRKYLPYYQRLKN